MKLEDLYTRKRAEESKEMEIKTIDGQPTGMYLSVLGSESTVFIQAKREYMRKQMLAKTDKSAVLSSEYEYATLVATLVTGWTFSEKFTEKKVFELMYESPYLAIQVDAFANSHGNKSNKEFQDAKNNSSAGQNKTSS